MQLPMEILSPMTPRTDSGTGPGNGASRASPNAGKDKMRFEKLFEEELQRHDMKMLKRRDGPRGDNEDKVSSKSGKSDESLGKQKPGTIDKKHDPPDDNAQALAAGVTNLAQRDMGIQTQVLEHEQQVVTILEGEESVTTPQMRIGDENEPELDTNVNTQPNNEQSANMVKEEQTLGTTIVPAETTDTENTERTVHADDSETAQFKDILAAKTETATKADKEDVAGEVTARTPQLESQESQISKDTDGGFNKEGNPSPLENDNEIAKRNAHETGHNENIEAYTQAEEETKAVKAVTVKANKETDEDAAESKPGNTATVPEAPPPLSNGIKPEQFKATEQMTQTALTRAVKPENLFEEMISKVQTVQDAAKSTMTIQLNPEHLGKVALEVAVDASGVHVKINAEDNNVRSMINSQLTTLVESLESKGITVSEVEVVFAGANFDSFSQQSGEHRGSAAEEKAAKRANAKDSIEYYTMVTGLMDYYLDAGISSVEYSA